MLLSYLWEPLQRSLLGTGRPFELLVMFSLKNVVLAMAAVSCWTNYRRWTVAASLFLVLFAAAMTTSATVQWLVSLFAAGAVCWLAASYWETLRGRLLAVQAHAHFPRSGLAAAALILAAALAGVGSTENDALTALAGWLPGSGGTGDYDRFARSGVGDGDALVAGTDHVQSFAPIEDAPFLSSDQPSLYDVFNDAYDEPVRLQNQDRTVALQPEAAADVERRLAESQQAQREFSTLRQGRTGRTRDVGDLASDALFYVAGRTPLHLRLETFDIFDGVRWYPEGERMQLPPLQPIERKGRVWLQLSSASRAFDIFPVAGAHALKIVSLDTNRVPAPLHLDAIHIDRVQNADLFDWDRGGIVCMRRQALPPLVPIHLSSRAADRRRIGSEVPVLGTSGRIYTQLPAMPHLQQLHRLAESWVAGVPRGWAQVETVERKLRAGYRHDRAGRAPEDAAFPVGHFLHHARCGPDYQFATAAALMLRSLGYCTRVVSGFYVDPGKYDARSRHTPVHKADVHFWVEVYLGASTWATVEPTPGYQLLAPPPGLLERMWSALVAAGAFCLRHLWTLCALSAMALVAYVLRLDIADALATGWWRWHARRPIRSQVLATLKLVEQRMAWSGLKRREHLSPRQWFRETGVTRLVDGDDLRSFADAADWAVFAPAEDAIPNADQIRACCGRMIHSCTLKRLRRLGRHESPFEKWRTRVETWRSAASSKLDALGTATQRGEETT
jgi:hypothetical protein